MVARKSWRPFVRNSVLFAVLAAAYLLFTRKATLYEAGVEPGRPPYLTIFLIDGLSQQVFQAELRAGRLPEIQRMITEGTYVEDGISAFPSMTGYAFFPFLTGRDAVESGVLGLRWFDRGRGSGNFRNYVGQTNVLMNQDSSKAAPTLFECFPGQRSFSVNSYANRGVKRKTNTGWAFTMAKYREHWWLPQALAWIPLFGTRWAPGWKGAEDEVLALALDDLEQRPKIQWITFASLDAYQHISGTGPDYPVLLRNVDALIGRYRERSRGLGLEQERIYAVLSDHGVVDVSENVDLGEALAGRHGLKLAHDQATYVWDAELERPLEDYEGFDGVVAINGNTMNYLYFRHPEHPGVEGWKHRLEQRHLRAYPGLRAGAAIDLVEAVQSVKGIELVVFRGEGASVEVHGAAGTGTILRSGGGWSYRASGVDPLGYAGDPSAGPLADGQPHDAEAWLKATHRSSFPFAPPRLYQLLADEDSGDLVVTAQAGYDLAKDFELFVGAYKGGHGGLRADQTRVPYVLSGAGVPRGLRVETALAETVGATFFELLGLRQTGGAPGQAPLFKRGAGIPPG